MTSEEFERMMVHRLSALEKAREFVAPIFEANPAEKYTLVSGSAGPFAVAPNTTVTPAEQVIGQMILVADWLLNDLEE